MAYNFPPDPQDGDTYNGYTFDGTLGAWTLPSSGGGGGNSYIYVSDIAPVDAPEDSIWFNSITGYTYILFNDGNTTQWVEFGGGQSGGGTSISVVAPLTNTGTISEPVIGISVGTEAGTVASGTDSRFSDERTPLDNSVTPEKIASGVIVNSHIDNNADIAQSKIENLVSDLSSKADLLSPEFTGVPLAPTATTGTNTTQIATTAFVNSELANLVASSPEAIDTLNELAAALGNDPDFATTVSTEIGSKVSKAGDVMTGHLTLSGSPVDNLHAATKSYVDSALAAEGSSRAASISAAVNAIDTDDIEEGTVNLYFTDERAVLATSTEYDPAGSADAAEASANSYTDSAILAKIPSNISSTEIGYLDGVSSGIQSQISTLASSKANTSHTHAQADVTNLESDLASIALDIEDLQAADLSVFKINPISISADYTMPSGYNGMSAGPITIADGITVTIPDGTSWSVV